MNPERSVPERLKPAVVPLSERLFQVATGNPEVFYLVDVVEGVCSCSDWGMKGYGGEPHVEKVREYLRLKKGKENQEGRNRWIPTS